MPPTQQRAQGIARQRRGWRTWILFALIVGALAFAIVRALNRDSTSGEVRSWGSIAQAQDEEDSVYFAPPTTDDEPNQPPPGSITALYRDDGELESITAADGTLVVDALRRALFPEELVSGTPAAGWLAAGAAINQLATIDGAYIDDATGELVFIGTPCDDDACPAHSLDDLLVAFQAVYGDDYPGVSIDPGSSLETMQVRYIGPVAETHAGWVMFEADRLMKNLGAGRDNVSGTSIVPSPPAGHKTLLELAAADGAATMPAASRHRFWIVVDRARLVQKTGGVVIEDLALRVNTEYLDENWQSLPPEQARVDPVAQAYADQLTSNYAAYAADYPVFSDLERLARLVAIAQWTRDQNVPMTGAALLTRAPLTYPTVATTPAITTSLVITNSTARRVEVATHLLWGGVDLRPVNTYEVEAGSELLQSAKAARPDSRTTAWSLVDHAHRAVAVALHAVRVRGAYQTSIAPVRLAAGSLTFDLAYDSMRESSQGLGRGWSTSLPVLHFPQPKGNYPPHGELYPALELMVPVTGMRFAFDGPWIRNSQGKQEVVYKTTAESADEVLVMTAAGGYQWDSAAHGQMFFDENGRLVSIRKGGDRLLLTYDASGALESVTASDGGGRHFRYDPSGNLAAVMDATGNNRPLVTFRYDQRARLAATYAGDGNIISAQHYDSLSRILAHWAEKTLLMFDWRQSRPRVYLLDESQTVFLEAIGIEELERLTQVNQLSQSPLLGTVVYVRILANRVLLLIDGKTLDLPIATLLDTDRRQISPEKLRSALLNQKLLPPEAERVFIANGDGSKIDFSQVFAGAQVLEAESLAYERILERARSLPTQPLDLTRTIVFNAIPGDAQSFVKVFHQGGSAANLAADQEEWVRGFQAAHHSLVALGDSQAVRMIHVGVGEARGDGSADESAADLFARALAQEQQVIIVVAHSDGDRIYFPDGSAFRPEEMSTEQRRLIADNRPLVIMIACEGADVRASGSLAKRILDLGAMAVIAPPAPVSSLTVAQLLQHFFGAALAADPIRAFQDTLELFRQEDRHYRTLIGQNRALTITS